MSVSAAASSALVGSSSTSSDVRRYNARAIPSRWRWPPLKQAPFWPTGVSSPCGSESTSASRRAARSASRTRASSIAAPEAANATFCATVASSSTTCCGTCATDASQRLRLRSSSATPSTSICPESGTSNPSSRSASVVLPEPFGPAKPTSVPARIRNDTSLTPPSLSSACRYDTPLKRISRRGRDAQSRASAAGGVDLARCRAERKSSAMRSKAGASERMRATAANSCWIGGSSR